MVSLWPWKGSDNSPASFEKTLSSLSGKIVQASTRLEAHRRRSRRFRVLWTLYSVFIYLLYAVIVTLVLGWQNWGRIEYSAVAGGPVLIYVVRAAGDTWYKYWIRRTQQTLEGLQKERDATIEKLKEATRYNSTLQLLEKYGRGSKKLESTPEEQPDGEHGDAPKPRQRRDPRDRASLPVMGGRTGLPPPPTANIRRNREEPPQRPSPLASPNQEPQARNVPMPHRPMSPPEPVPQAEFHPSAFPSSQQYNESHPPRWYDRILDVLLGEDETLAKNRLALICKECRLVNGQAPPGVRTPEEVGRWRCGGCGAWNGEDIVAKVTANQPPIRPPHKRSRSQSMPHPMSQPSAEEQRQGGGPWDPMSSGESVGSALDGEYISAGDATDASMLMAAPSSEGNEREDEAEQDIGGDASESEGSSPS